MKNFIKFWFEGNLSFGYIENQNDVNELLKRYNGDLQIILRAREKSVSSINIIKELTANLENHKEFGLYSEHRGDLTLEQWLIDNDMIDYFKNV